jgi:hypothetical protein
MNVKIWYKILKCLGSMITMHKVHNKWQCFRDIDEVQSVFDIHWQDEASRRHEVAYNILRLKFEEFYQNKKFTYVKNEVIFVQIYCDSTLQLVVHAWCLARKKTSSNWLSMFGV